MSDSQYKPSIVVTPKPWWQSKTQIYNAIKTVLSFGAMVATFLVSSQQAGILPVEIDIRWALLFIAFDGAVSMWLRSVTNQPITGGN